MENYVSICISVQNAFGPMARDVDGLVQGMRALWDGYMFDLDPSVVPMTFDEEVSRPKDKLNIASPESEDRCYFCISAHLQ